MGWKKTFKVYFFLHGVAEELEVVEETKEVIVKKEIIIEA